MAAILAWRRVLRRIDSVLLPDAAVPGQVTSFDFRRIVLLIAGLALAVFVPSLLVAQVPADLWLPMLALSTVAAVWVSASFLMISRDSPMALMTPVTNGIILGVVGVVIRPYYHSTDLLIPLLVSGHAILQGLGSGLVAVVVGTLVVVYAIHDPAQANASELAYAAIYLTGSALLPWAAWRLAQRRAHLLAQAQRQSEARRARLEAVLQSMDDAVVVVDEAANPLLTNPAYEAMRAAMGGRIEPLDGRGRRFARNRTPWARASRGEAFELTFSARMAGGERRWYESRGGPIGAELEPGRGKAGIVVITDITDRSLRRQQEQFMATASHELRTPIAALHGYVQLLERRLDASTQPRESEYARVALSQTRRLAHLLDRLFDLARLQTGRLEVDRARVDLVSVVEAATSSVAPLTAGRDVQLRAPRDAIVVLADAGRLEQVLVNLLSNALIHAPQSPSIEIDVSAASDRATVSVTDHGPGIPRDRQARLLGRPGTWSSRGARQAGLGLGLFISRELVRAQGGQFEIDSSPGVGTKITVHLPLADRQ